MQQITHYQGTRAELVRILKELEKGWNHFGNKTLERESREAADKISQGAMSAQAGHTLYRVIGE